MSYRGREIEVKLLVPDSKLDQVRDILQNLFSSEITKSLYDTSIDTYYSIPSPDLRADFLRVREMGSGTLEITVKAKDKEDNLDRMELNIYSDSNKSTVKRLFTAALGRSSGVLEKTYYVYWLDDLTTISCYQVLQPEKSRDVIIEVESDSEDRVLDLEAKVLRELRRSSIVGATRGTKSLYEMYIQDKQEGTKS